MRIKRPPSSEDDIEQLSVFEDEPDDDEEFSVDSSAIIYTMKPLENSNIAEEEQTAFCLDMEQDTLHNNEGGGRNSNNNNGTSYPLLDDTASQLTEDTFDLDVIKLASVDEVANMALLKERKKRRLPFVCRIGYIFLFHMVLLSFLTAATKAIYQQQARTIAADDNDDEGILTAYIHTLSDSSSFQDITSPQSQALQWVKTNNYPDYYLEEEENDTTKKQPNDILLQHYVLALLYFGLDGPNWRHQERWLWNSTSVCEWYTSHHPSYNTYQGGSSGISSNSPYTHLCSGDGMLLQVLDLSSNNLRGTIPTELGLLSNHLKQIKLHRNMLSGTIPTELSQLTSLLFLGLDENELVGEVPTNLAQNMPNLRDLILFGNQLEGSIPEELCDLQKDGREVYESSNLVIAADCETGDISCNCACTCF